MHGGANGSGAPPGNHNALKHGLFTKESIELHATLRKGSGPWLAFSWPQRQANTRSEANARTTLLLSRKEFYARFFQSCLHLP
jgi:hypothetical protein